MANKSLQRHGQIICESGLFGASLREPCGLARVDGSIIRCLGIYDDNDGGGGGDEEKIIIYTQTPPLLPPAHMQHSFPSPPWLKEIEWH